MTKKDELTMEASMHMIIDELHPLFKASSDEELIEDHEDHGVFTRSFKTFNGNEYLMKWSVYYGTPETVKTVFEPIQLIGTK